MNKTFGSFLLIFLFLSFSCGDRSENRLIIEAASIHEKMLTKHDSLKSMLQEQESRVNAILAKTPASNPDRVAYEAMERSIKRGYGLLSNWKSALDDEPSHLDYTGKGENTRNRSDKEILDIQKAYSTRLDEVGMKINELLATVEMYTKDEN